MLCGIGLRFNLLGGDVFGRVSDKRSSEDREQPVGFQSAEALAASTMPAAVQRRAIAAFRHHFTLRQTRRTVPIMFSISAARLAAPV
jgi:hypothetical protein